MTKIPALVVASLPQTRLLLPLCCRVHRRRNRRGGDGKNKSKDSISFRSLAGDGADQRLPAKGQLGLSAPVITAHFCVKRRHKGSPSLCSQRRASASASEMVMKSLSEVCKQNSSARFHKSPRKMIIDAEINLTIIGRGETFSNKQADGKSRHLAVDHHDHSWIVPEGGIFISAQQMGGMRFSWLRLVKLVFW